MCERCEMLTELERMALHTAYNRDKAREAFPVPNYHAVQGARRERRTTKRNARKRIISANRENQHAD